MHLRVFFLLLLVSLGNVLAVQFPQAVFAVGKTQYIETEKKQNYRICLENDRKGFWNGAVPFVMSTENCLLVTTPN